MEAIGADVMVVALAMASAPVALSGVRRRRETARAMERRAAELTRLRQAYLASKLPVRSKRTAPLPVGVGADSLEEVTELRQFGDRDSHGLAA